MTVLEDVSDLLKQLSPQAMCDDCIAERLNLSLRQHANHKTRELASMSGFVRRDSRCACCGAGKRVIAYIP
ncbi:hypothetical protein [Citreimonas salinaria]|uniref:Uncharacterized protein n=1 Tax=Citreimonas salinaria TaxID=321339 RepID=A0A1H3J890_9RHOB|nr:hypothetical protein [Citreimonas salinaria]SDY36220.1 hypothetical protein SAMN05444340_106124 [Citreimonas salinaria]